MTVLTKKQGAEVIQFPPRGVYCPPSLDRWPKPSPLRSVIAVALVCIAGFAMAWLACGWALDQLALYTPPGAL